jgi:hypothetical protein
MRPYGGGQPSGSVSLRLVAAAGAETPAAGKDAILAVTKDSC